MTMKFFLAMACVLLPMASWASDTLPGITGTVKYHPQFPSKHVAPRNVEVWLPPSYEKETAKPYPVLYMHDGQNLFNPRTSFIGVDWGVDEAMTKLIAEGKIRYRRRRLEHTQANAGIPAGEDDHNVIRGSEREAQKNVAW
jgi:hypothetical protein